jgi:hypothetical protein
LRCRSWWMGRTQSIDIPPVVGQAYKRLADAPAAGVAEASQVRAGGFRQRRARGRRRQQAHVSAPRCLLRVLNSPSGAIDWAGAFSCRLWSAVACHRFGQGSLLPPDPPARDDPVGQGARQLGPSVGTALPVGAEPGGRPAPTLGCRLCHPYRDAGPTATGASSLTESDGKPPHSKVGVATTECL